MIALLLLLPIAWADSRCDIEMFWSSVDACERYYSQEREKERHAKKLKENTSDAATTINCNAEGCSGNIPIGIERRKQSPDQSLTIPIPHVEMLPYKENTIGKNEQIKLRENKENWQCTRWELR